VGVEIDARFAWLCSVSGNPRCAPAHWLSSLRGVAIGASIGGNLFSNSCADGLGTLASSTILRE
jgi:hypothetical protein